MLLWVGLPLLSSIPPWSAGKSKCIGKFWQIGPWGMRLNVSICLWQLLNRSLQNRNLQLTATTCESGREDKFLQAFTKISVILQTGCTTNWHAGSVELNTIIPSSVTWNLSGHNFQCYWKLLGPTQSGKEEKQDRLMRHFLACFERIVTCAL